MRRTAGSLVLHSMLPIGELRDYHRSTVVPVTVYFLSYSYLSVAMDHSHPTLASFWQVRTEHISTPLDYTIHIFLNVLFLKESPWFYQSTLFSLLPPITALTLLWSAVNTLRSIIAFELMKIILSMSELLNS